MNIPNKIDIAVLAQIINDVWDAVERSKQGEIYLRDPDGKFKMSPEGNFYTHQLAHQTFLTILNNVLPKNFTSPEIK